ncbi:PDDEXK nuclease domain-containing protein [uncultured Duncaniella sp.]|uniref:PDDEXK nuclease domain-containing protein n=1 Tax=uncultured Duncaniella sp. TaxID=2768039 RepID=UPI0025E7B19D|nr:PDDEXK nuclease domain-containing protein [uncultured Duncaniella sp.]
MTAEIDTPNLPVGYAEWRRKIVTLIENAKLNAAIHVNTDMLSLYWSIGSDIIRKKKELGWGAQVIEQLSLDLTRKFPEDKGYSVRNLHYMRRFAENYPDFPILQVPLAEFKNLPISQAALAELAGDKDCVDIPLSTISWYHHISMLPKIKNNAERAFYILETTRNGWSRDVMLSKINGGYMKTIGNAVTNFTRTLPEYQSDLARYAFKDPYNFSFIGTMALQHERDIENSLAERMTEFLLELGHGFAYVGRQYNVVVDGDDYYIDILMYHLKLHCYVVVELKAVEFIPEFVSKLNFYISAVDEYVKSPEDKPTIGLLLCRNKSNKKAEFALRGITQPMGIAQYETEKLFKDVASALPTVEGIEEELDY